MTFYIVIALLAFMLSLLGTRVSILAQRRRAQPLDVARLREGKAAPLKGGGIVVVFTLIICLLAADISYGIVLSLLLLVAISVLDDLIGVPLPVRLIVQVMAVTVPLSMTGVLLFQGLLAPWLDKIVTGVLWIGCTNMFKAMDDLDGLTAAETISIGSGLSLLAVLAGIFPDALSIYGLVLATAGCGFLWWNWPPAKISMGSVGATPIGFLTGYLLIVAALSGYPYAAIILPAYYVCDSLLTWIPHGLSNRRGLPVYYYRKALAARRPAAALRLIIGINILLVFLALRAELDPELAIFYIGLAYGTAFVLLSWFSMNKPAKP